MTRPSWLPTATSGRLTRRSLVAGGVVTAGAAGLAGAWWAVGDRSSPPAPATATPPARTGPGPAPTSAPSPVANDLPPIEQATVRQLRQALDTRQLSVKELVEASIARIEAMDGGDHGLGAVIEINPQALEIAWARDKEIGWGRPRGPLHGIPVLAKDVFATADAMATSAGSTALLENNPVADAFIIARLRDAGAVILGKANLTEWSSFKSGGQTPGWSTRGGQTRNPYQLDHSPWGSSSGSGVAVAAGYVPLALGVETDGSIVAPASAASVVGLKPTVGLTSRSGVIPISYTQDSPGPMARTVEDAAYLLTVMAGFDPWDPAYGDVGWTSPAAMYPESQFPVHQPGAVDYTQFLIPDGLVGARIGVARNMYVDIAAGAIVDEALLVMEEAGAEVVDPANIPSAGGMEPGSTYVVTLTEFTYSLERFLSIYTPDGPMLTPADILAFYEARAEAAGGVFADTETARSIWDAEYQETVATNLSQARQEGIDAVLDEYELDALVAPTTGPPTMIDEGFTGASCQMSSISGYPILNVPIGYIDGLPVGMSFMGRAFSEPTLLKIAYALEQIRPIRRPPEYLLGSLA